jgi:hypothetical protein
VKVSLSKIDDRKPFHLKHTALAKAYIRFLSLSDKSPDTIALLEWSDSTGSNVSKPSFFVGKSQISVLVSFR